jgi:hypothetical protein
MLGIRGISCSECQHVSIVRKAVAKGNYVAKGCRLSPNCPEQSEEQNAREKNPLLHAKSSFRHGIFTLAEPRISGSTAASRDGFKKANKAPRDLFSQAHPDERSMRRKSPAHGPGNNQKQYKGWKRLQGLKSGHRHPSFLSHL